MLLLDKTRSISLRICRAAVRASVDAPRSAANLAAVPSSTPRISIVSTTSLRLKLRTTNPPPLARSSKPSSASWDRAARIGVREISSSSASATSNRRVPPSISPLMMRWRSVTRARCARVDGVGLGIDLAFYVYIVDFIRFLLLCIHRSGRGEMEWRSLT